MLFKFVKSAGEALKKTFGSTSEGVEDRLKEHESAVADLTVEETGDKIVLKGKAKTQADVEKAILSAGNTPGVAEVESLIEVAESGPEPVFYEVKSGDTLSAIAQEQYGAASKYPEIFEANRPMLSHPDKIYPGQVLRIPPLD